MYVQMRVRRERLEIQLASKSEALGALSEESARLRADLEAAVDRAREAEAQNRELREKMECLRVDADIKESQVLFRSFHFFHTLSLQVAWGYVVCRCGPKLLLC